MKRIFLFTLCVGLLVSLSACHRPAEESSVPVESGTTTSTSVVTTTTTTSTTTSKETTVQSTVLPTTTVTQTTTTTTTTTTKTATPTTTIPATQSGVSTTPATQSTATTTSVTKSKVSTSASATQLPTTQPVEEPDDFAVALAVNTVDESRVYDGYTEGMDHYYQKVLPTFLAGSAGENRVCSPLNVYLALCLLAETAEGETRQQLLTLLGETEIETVQKRSAALWNSLYTETDSVKCLLANSLWLNKACESTYRQSTAQRLADDYYTSVFQGIMGSEDYNTALRTWIDDNTGGLLKEQTAGEEFKPEQVLGLVSTVYFKAPWVEAFSAKTTEDDVFHTAREDVTCAFMQDRIKNTVYYRGGEFAAITRRLHGGFSMWFVLPDEGVTVDAVLQDAEMTAMLARKNESGWQRCDLVLKIPKFDVTYRKGLVDDLKQLGVTDVFDPAKADLSAMFQEQKTPIYVNGVNHTTRIMVDEEGVEAAAYTDITMSGTALPQELETIYFTADRPFLFAVTGPDGTLLFAGVIENPAA